MISPVASRCGLLLLFWWPNGPFSESTGLLAHTTPSSPAFLLPRQPAEAARLPSCPQHTYGLSVARRPRLHFNVLLLATWTDWDRRPGLAANKPVPPISRVRRFPGLRVPHPLDGPRSQKKIPLSVTRTAPLSPVIRTNLVLYIQYIPRSICKIS
jgi:hypothetical protein